MKVLSAQNTLEWSDSSGGCTLQVGPKEGWKISLPSERGHWVTNATRTEPVTEGNKARLEVLLEPEAFILSLISIDSQSTIYGHCAGDRDEEVEVWYRTGLP